MLKISLKIYLIVNFLKHIIFFKKRNDELNVTNTELNVVNKCLEQSNKDLNLTNNKLEQSNKKLLDKVKQLEIIKKLSQEKIEYLTKLIFGRKTEQKSGFILYFLYYCYVRLMFDQPLI